METTNCYSAEWLDFVKHEKRIYRALDWGATAFANREPFLEATDFLTRRFYRHQLVCKDGLARYFCNNVECAVVGRQRPDHGLGRFRVPPA